MRPGAGSFAFSPIAFSPIALSPIAFPPRCKPGIEVGKPGKGRWRRATRLGCIQVGVRHWESK